MPAGKEQAGSGLRVGWHGDIDDVAAGFATELAIIAGDGARDCFARWARLLRDRLGSRRAARDSDVLGTRLSYWTDNGSAYWYRTEPGLDPASTIVAAVDDLEARGVPVGAVQLDSWWYPHEVLRPFDTDEWVVPPSGHGALGTARRRAPRRRRRAARTARPAAAGHALPAPVVAVAVSRRVRDVDRRRPRPPAGRASSTSGCSTRPSAWGVEVFEHDWLIECFLGVRGSARRRAAPRRGRKASTPRSARANLHAQWCMASPADFAQASRLQHVTSIRTSGDHGYLVGPEVLWAWFLHNERDGARPRAVAVQGRLPFARRRRRRARSRRCSPRLSAGPVGIGDRIGEADVDLVRRTCRADGVLVRPDVPDRRDRPRARSTRRSGRASRSSAPRTRSTRPAAGATCSRATSGSDKNRARGTVSLPDLGEDRPGTGSVALYDWRTGRIDVMAADGGYDVALEPAGWDYRVRRAGARRRHRGDRRSRAVRVRGRHAASRRVVADGDGVVSPCSARANACACSGGRRRRSVPASGQPRVASRARVANDLATGTWEVSVSVPAAGWAKVHLRTA